MFPTLITTLAIFSSLIIGQDTSTLSLARSPAVPPAVESPYLNAVLDAGTDGVKDGGNGGYLPGQWPQLWANQIVGWFGRILIDGTTKTWMGAPPAPQLVKQTGFLVNESLIPARQISTNDFAGLLANQTDLALKGMIGIGAMAQIANMTGNIADANKFSSIESNYKSQWMTLGVAKDADPSHTTLGYFLNDTHRLLYSLYSDKLLSISLVTSSVYDQQSTFYLTVLQKYGAPLDTQHNYTKSDRSIFAATIASPSTQSLVISTPSNGAFTDIYDVQTGNLPSTVTFKALPVVGSHFALLPPKNVESVRRLIQPTARATADAGARPTAMDCTRSQGSTKTSTGGAVTSTAKKSQAASSKPEKKEGDWKVWVGVGVLGVICGGIFLFDLQL